MQPGNLHRQRFRTQSEAFTGAAGSVVLVAFKFFTYPIAVSLTIAAFHVGDDPFKHAADLINAPAFIITELDFFLARPAQEYLLHLGVQILPFGVLVEPVMFGNRLNRLFEVRAFPLAPGG